jgi:glucokinase
VSGGIHDADGTSTVGVDIGGTKVLAGTVDAAGRVLSRVRGDTPPSGAPAAAVEDVVVALVGELRTAYDVSAVGVGAAGFVDRQGGVAFAPHLSWREEPLAAKLTERLGVPVVVDNDANVAALAELRLGAARGRRDVVCVTLGTGIGGAVVLDGEVRRGGHGFAGEFGHVAVEPDGRDCPCGQRGCWEQYCSGTALVRAANALEGTPAGVTGVDVTLAAGAGEPWAVTAFEEIGTWLGHGLAGVCAALDPELVVIGGGLVDAGDLLLDPARAMLEKRLVGAGSRPTPPIVPAALGPEAGFIGAALRAHAVSRPE